MRLTKSFRFEASHRLPHHTGKCKRLHGHSWELLVSVDGHVDNATGFVMDYAELKASVQPLINSLDHKHLGTWEGIADTDETFKWQVMGIPNGFYPSSENLIGWIALQLQKLPWSLLELKETCTCSCTLTREEYDAGQNEI